MRDFTDRTEAGRVLARLLTDARLPDPAVLALPRGGVPVGLEIARALRCPLDLVMVRKIGVPSQPELAAGAVVNGETPEIVVNERIAAHARLDRAAIERLAEVQLAEIRHRRSLWLAGRAPVALAGRTAIVVDDGIATGATMRAALKATRRRGPARLVLAVPVAAPDTLDALRPLVDEVVCAMTPAFFGAVGAHYRAFDQVSDDAVAEMLAEADGFAPRADSSGPG